MLLNKFIELINDHVQVTDATKTTDNAKRQRKKRSHPCAGLLLNCSARTSVRRPKRERKEIELKNALIQLKGKEIDDRNAAQVESARERDDSCND